MPSPVGHAIAGATIAWALAPHENSQPQRRFPLVTPLTLLCVGLAVAPDLDLVVQGHRMATHSVLAVAVITILIVVVTGKVTRSQAARRRIVLACAAAYASHIALDWLAVDPSPPMGVQALWPFTDGWYISNVNLFRGTARRDIFTAQSMWINGTAIAQEIAILGPLAWLTRLIRGMGSGSRSRPAAD